MPPFEQMLDAILWAVLPAFATAAIVFGLMERFSSTPAPAGAALGVIAGAALGFYLRNLFVLMPGESTWNRLPWASLAAVCIGRVAGTRADAWLLRGAAAFTVCWWVVPEPVRTQTTWLVPTLAAVITVQWLILGEIADGSTAVCLTMCFLAAGAVQLYAGIAKFMECATVLASAFAGLAAVAWRRRADIRGAIPVAAVTLPLLQLMGQSGSVVESLHWSAYALPALAPLTLVVTLPWGRSTSLRMICARLVLVAIPLVAALILARVQAGPLNFGHEEW